MKKCSGRYRYPPEADGSGTYAEFVLPRLTQLSMRQAQLRSYRQRATTGARGRILELGFGSGLNLPFYGRDVKEIVGVDVSHEMLVLARPAVAASPHNVTLVEHSAERLPFDAAHFDTVVVTWSLCSIPDPLAALKEVRRVLKSDGQLRFVEHGLSPDAGVRKWQEWLTPNWSRCAGGCHLNRKIDDLVRSAGFQIAQLSTGYGRGLWRLTCMYEGPAIP